MTAPNVLYYPPDFPSATANDTGASGEEATVQTAIRSLGIQARDTAVQAAHTRLASGQMSSGLQTQAIASFPTLMPLYEIGNVPKVKPFLGTAAYLGGGRGHGSSEIPMLMYQLPFSNETFILTGIRLTAQRLYCSALADVTAGRFIGGWTSNQLDQGVTSDKLSWGTRSLHRLGVQLNGQAGAAGGIGDKVKGFLLGGTYGNAFSCRHALKWTYATESYVMLANALSQNRLAPHNGMCSKFSGYIGGGSDGTSGWFTGSYNSFERVTIANDTCVPIAAVLSEPHIVHAAMNYDLKGFFGGGGSASVYYSNGISSLTYSGETAVKLSSTLAEPKICADGVSSSANGYVVGGDTASTGWTGSMTTDRLSFANTVCLRIGARLTADQADQGGTSDYGPGFSY